MKAKTLNVDLIRIGAQIGRIRKSLEIPLAQLALVTGIDAKRLGQIEKGLAEARYLELLAISRALDCQIHELVYFDIII